VIVEAAVTENVVTGKRRFDVLLGGAHSPEAASYDRPLFTCADWLVAPTLGAIVPNWLLLIPRDPILNFRAWCELRNQSPEQLLCEVRQHLGLRPDETIWFEHGPRRAGTVTGCGLDHAHIHILIRPRFSFEEFIKKTKLLSKLEWVDGAYDKVSPNQSYLIAGSNDTAIVARNVETTGSQFFRRVVGELANVDDAWDYRRYPYVDNITETIATFRSLERAVQRGG
jgi:ATP adenylyltransferase